jgi:bacterial/archaeal transporter family-2 protein
MTILWILIGVISGACIAVQAPINAQLGREIGMPFAAAFVSFGSGAIILGLLTFGIAAATQTTLHWNVPAPWMFVAGGLLGMVYVVSAIVLTPQIGAAAVMGLAVTGQLVAGLVVDRVGFMGMAVREVSLGRLAGAGLLVAGAVMIRLL